MKKIICLAITLIALTFAMPAMAQQKKKTPTRQPAKTAQATTMTMETFMKKWGRIYEAFCDGQIEYGWSKQFFVDMQKVMPNHFKMVKVTAQGGLVYYKCVLILPNDSDVNVGALAFQGTKLHSAEINRWELDYEYAQQVRQEMKWDFNLEKP